MGIVVLVIVIVTTVWVGIDASGRDYATNSGPSSTGGWLAGCLLLWIIFFPWYLVARSRAIRAHHEELLASQTSNGASPAGAQAVPAAVADWYPDPRGEARLRYWDGRTWTDHTAT
jgi:hypothetical protein